MEYIEFVVTKDGLKPGKRKMITVENFRLPKNVHEVRRFLGLTGFFRRFVQNYAQIAKPLSDLTKKSEEFVMNNEVINAFQRMKDVLVDAPILKLYDLKAPKELHTDVSAIDLAG